MLGERSGCSVTTRFKVLPAYRAAEEEEEEQEEEEEEECRCFLWV